MCCCCIFEFTETTINIGPEEEQPLLPIKEAQHRIKSIKEKCRNLKYNIITSTDRTPKPGTHRPQFEQSSRNYNWWTKFFNSFSYSTGTPPAAFKHSLRIFDSELENQSEFGQLRDWADCVHLTSRTGSSKHPYADLKLSVQIRQCSELLGLYSLNK